MALEATLGVNAAADAVTFTLRVRNAGDDPVELSFRSAKQFDVVVEADGEEAWRWSDGRLFAQVLTSATLGPGEETSFDGTWESPREGEFTARATLESDPGVEVEERFSVP